LEGDLWTSLREISGRIINGFNSIYKC
jgi:hypothetical protein